MKKNHLLVLVIITCFLQFTILPFLLSCSPKQTIKETVTYTIGMTAGPLSQNPYVKSTSPSERLPMYLVYEPLIETDTWNNTWPWLADSWKFDAASKSLTYYLNKKAKWSDGVDVTANDVKFTWDSMIANNVSFYTKGKDIITSIEVVDSKTVKFNLVDTYWSAVLLIGNRWIIPKHIWSSIPDADKAKDPNSNPVGSGPYLWKEFVVNDHCLLEKNPNYWKQELSIDRIILKKYANEDSNVLALKSGDVDALDKIVTFTQVPGLLRNQNIEVTLNDRNSTECLLLNLRIEPFNIKEFRQALNILFDKNSMVNVGVFGYGTISANLSAHSPRTSFYDKTLEWPYTDKTQAERLSIANAKLNAIPGMSAIGTDGLRTYNGKKLIFNLLHISDNMRTQCAAIIQENAKSAGIQFTLQSKGSTTIQSILFVDFVTKPLAWDAAVFPNSQTGSWDDIALGYTSPTSIGPSAGWSNPIQSKIEKTRIEIDETKRLSLIREIQPVLAEEMIHIPLYLPTYVSANRNDRFTGWISDLCDVAIVTPNGSLVQILALKPK